MRVALSGMDIFRIFKFLINEKKHCNSIPRKKYDHLESELDIIVSQKIDPYLFGIIVNHFLVLWIDVYTLKCSMLRNNLFQDNECFNILYKLVFQIFIRRELQLNLQQLHRFPGYNYLEVGLFSLLILVTAEHSTFVFKKLSADYAASTDGSSSHLFDVRVCSKTIQPITTNYVNIWHLIFDFLFWHSQFFWR